MPPPPSLPSSVGLSWLDLRTSRPQTLLDSGAFTDVELRVSGRVFRAHKLILAAHSEFFEHLLAKPHDHFKRRKI